MADGAGAALHYLLKEPVMAFVGPWRVHLALTVERPLRLGEFDDLFAGAVRQVDSVSPTRADAVDRRGWAGVTVRDLTARETVCCSFFAFTVTPEPAEDGEALTLDVEVPPQYADVLATLVERASPVTLPDRLPPVRSSSCGC